MEPGQKVYHKQDSSLGYGIVIGDTTTASGLKYKVRWENGGMNRARISEGVYSTEELGLCISTKNRESFNKLWARLGSVEGEEAKTVFEIARKGILKYGGRIVFPGEEGVGSHDAAPRVIYRERIVEVPVEKIVYRDRPVGNTPPPYTPPRPDTYTQPKPKRKYTRRAPPPPYTPPPRREEEYAYRTDQNPFNSAWTPPPSPPPQEAPKPRTDHAVKMTARKNGVCGICNKTLFAGQSIFWHPVTKVTCHEGCVRVKASATGRTPEEVVASV